MSASQQSDLCLSCGVPFMPSADQVEFFKHKGNLSILFLNVEFQQNRDLQRTHKILKFTSQLHASHVFHESHHIAAVHYMTNRHRGDTPLIWPAGAGAVRRLPNAFNQAFAYVVPPKGANPQPYAATWAPPPTRLDYGPLLQHILAAAGRHRNRDALLGQNLIETHAICAGCNFIMTQEANMKYHLGISSTAAQNPYGGIIRGQPIRERPVLNNGMDVRYAYGNWDVDMAANAEQSLPTRTPHDALAPHLAYYLHMCLPRGAVANPFTIPGSGRAARRLYLELSWVLLAIACVTTLIEDGKRYGDGRLSHGPQQHLGVLDFYISYFMWRLLEFEHTEAVRQAGLDFIQWHQKYYCEAVHCKALFPPNTRSSCNFIGFLAYGTTHQNSTAFVQDICARLMRLYTGELQPLILFVSGQAQGLPPQVKNYFVPLRTMRELRNRSNLRVVPNDFETALQTFGANALLQRIIQLCTASGCPKEFLAQLKGFRTSWRWREIERIRQSSPDLDTRTAFNLYSLCSLLQPTRDMPVGKTRVEAVLSGPLCSPWASVLSLDTLGAFNDPLPL